MDNSAVFWSRALTELTLSFHIVFATLGVGVPLMILIAQYVGYKKNDIHYTLMARRWARGFTITVAVGVVTGTIIGLQLSFLLGDGVSTFRTKPRRTRKKVHALFMRSRKW